MPAVEFRHVSKTFVHSTGPKLLRSHMLEWAGRKPEDPFYALRDVSFALEHGESLGIIGSNGAGKSTLLSLVTGLCPPDEGVVRVEGRLAAVLELGSGFHPDLTGEENLRLNAALLGMSRSKAAAAHEEIVEFAGLEDFIHEPVRTYSAGMSMRLAFSVAVHLDPDVLVIDEVIAVGDQAFQNKCAEKIAGFRKSGKTILCVSHAPSTIRAVCDRALWLERGRVQRAGDVEAVLEAYSTPAAESHPG